MRFGGDGGERVFRKLCLSPFDDKDIESYLNKRFTWYQKEKKRRTWQIVQHSPNLMILRPMLLSHIEDLLPRESLYSAPFMVYAELMKPGSSAKPVRTRLNGVNATKRSCFSFRVKLPDMIIGVYRASRSSCH